MCGDDDDGPRLGPCCMCESADGVRNIIMLSRRGAVPGKGWGCVVCGLPTDGAYAVLCDECLDVFQANNELLTVACHGYPAEGRRIAISLLPEGVFDHDPSKHAEDYL